jgi:hypothetical protein
MNIRYLFSMPRTISVTFVPFHITVPASGHQISISTRPTIAQRQHVVGGRHANGVQVARCIQVD